MNSVDGTKKFLFDMGGGDTIETVMIPSRNDRYTLCVSSEVGCNMGCKFCFTGKQKMKRRLTTAEIVGQFLYVNDHQPENQKITNIVFMGMGEPLDNPDNVFRAIEILHSPWGLGLSRKKITVSTSGIVPLMPRITESGSRLAVSLNGVDDEVRTRVMPINARWPIAELMQACLDHCRASKDKVTFEYVLLKGVTDSLEDARRLYRLTLPIPCKINIIPFNEHPGSGFERPDEQRIVDFQNELMRLGAHVLRRKTMGRDIYAACGQLTSAYEKHPNRMSVEPINQLQA
jgi:23S rRNA (adenine2503-C2)-methyltransferase